MKKKLFTIAIALCMVFTMIPGGVFQIETAWADTTSSSGTSKPVEKIYIGGKELSSTAGFCYHNATEDEDAKVDNVANGANAILDPESGTLTLYNLNVNATETGVKGIQWGVEGNASNYIVYDLTIDIPSGSNNTITSKTSTGIAGDFGFTNGPSLTIKGEGKLTVSGGATGIWVWKDITIEGDPTISVIGKNGISNRNDSSSGKISINGGTLTISADEQAMGIVPTCEYSNFNIIASKDKSGDPATGYLVSEISEYKYLKFTQKHNHCICGAEHESVGDHTSKRTITFEAWDKTNSLPSSPGYYYLKKDVTLDWTWNIDGAEGEVILCLNGHKISTKADGYYQYNRLINVDKSNLTLTNCRGTGKVINEGSVSNIRGIDITYSGYPNYKSIFNMYAITIEGFTNGGVYLTDSAGKFNMYSGIIQNNSSEYYGGGVTAYPNHGFYMYGGTITNNTTEQTGGGVWVNASNSFIIGGKVTITGNYKITGTEKIANNVYLANNDNIAISNTASTESTIGVTTRIRPTEDSDAVTIAKGADGSNIMFGELEKFKNCFISDVDSSRIRPVFEANAIKFKYFAKTPQVGFAYSENTVGKTYGAEAFTNETLTRNDLKETPKITYSSSNKNIAVVDSETGEVTIKGAGTAVITATAAETANYAEATASYTINVAKLQIIAPTEDSTKYVYDGTEKNYKFTNTQDSWYYTITGNTPQTNANEDGYIITVSLDEPENTEWTDGTSGDKTYKFIIARKAITAPTADSTKYVYDGTEKTYTFGNMADAEYYTISGNTIQTNANEDGYTITVSLNDKQNTVWTDRTSGDKTYQFVIQKQQIADPELIKSMFVYSGETITPEFKEKPDKFTLVGATSAKDAYVDGSYMITATPKANYKLSDNREDVNLLWNITKADLIIQPKDISIQEGDELPTNFEVYYNKLKGGDKAETAVTGTMQFELLKDDGTALSDSKTAGEYIIRVKNAEEITSENYNLKFETAKLTITKKSSSSGGGSYIQRPTIVTDEGGNASLNYNGSKLTITAKDGYEITDVLVNGVSKGAVTELTGLKTGDKVEVKTAKKAEPSDPTEPTNPSTDKNAKIVKGVENTTIVLKSKLTKNGNVLLTWTKSKGYKVDKFEFYRSVKKNSGYGTKAFFTTKDGSWSKYLNTKELKAGKTYYYKVRGVRVIDGKEYYTQWSNKAWRTIK